MHVEDLYPFGPEAGDNEMDKSDDGIVTVPVDIGFPVNTRTTYQIHVRLAFTLFIVDYLR